MITGPLTNADRALLLREGWRMARQQGIEDLLGEDFSVLVRYDISQRRVVYSFRAKDDQSHDDPADAWIKLC